MATLHFVCGKAGSGKTTLARTLARRLRLMLAPHIVALLQLGVSVVLDFAGNTPRDRAWVRSIFERADANHVLHVIDVDDETCRARVHARNEMQPDGVFFGVVSDQQLDEVNRFFVPPHAGEGFTVVVESAART